MLSLSLLDLKVNLSLHNVNLQLPVKQRSLLHQQSTYCHTSPNQHLDILKIWFLDRQFLCLVLDSLFSASLWKEDFELVRGNSYYNLMSLEHILCAFLLCTIPQIHFRLLMEPQIIQYVILKKIYSFAYWCVLWHSRSNLTTFFFLNICAYNL